MGQGSLDRGVVFLDYVLFPWRTVLENVAFDLEITKIPHGERLAKARKQIAAVGLSGFADRYPSQQRLFRAARSNLEKEAYAQ
jgi:NitT/TauT family transport system ATP-binding protein